MVNIKNYVLLRNNDVTESSNNVLEIQITKDKVGQIGESQLFEVTSLSPQPSRFFYFKTATK